MSTTNNITPLFFDKEITEKFVDDATGYACFLRKVTFFGRTHWCGYVQVPANHPFFGLNDNSPMLSALDVHGGVTFCEFLEDAYGIFLIGFDCSHFTDYLDPKSREYALRELQHLSLQLATIARYHSIKNN